MCSYWLPHSTATAPLVLQGWLWCRPPWRRQRAPWWAGALRPPVELPEGRSSKTCGSGSSSPSTALCLCRCSKRQQRQVQPCTAGLAGSCRAMAVLATTLPQHLPSHSSTQAAAAPAPCDIPALTVAAALQRRKPAAPADCNASDSSSCSPSAPAVSSPQHSCDRHGRGQARCAGRGAGPAKRVSNQLTAALPQSPAAASGASSSCSCSDVAP